METSVRKLPLWAWWLLGLAAIIAVSAGVVWFVRTTRPSLPPGLTELRQAVSKVLEESSRVEEVDIKPLVELEAKKDYAGATALMERALSQNASQEELAASLLSASESLTKLAVRVRPDEIATKAIEAFGILAQFAAAEKKFYEDRRALYEVTHGYYAGLAAKKKPAIPENLNALVEQVNADLKKAEALRDRFAEAVKAFDEAVQR